jgi:hypothetical protein
MRIAALTIALVLLASCSMPLRIELGNLSSETIVVSGASLEDGRAVIAASGSAELIGLDSPIRARFSVASGADVLQYETSGFPGDYVNTTFTGRRLKAQFGIDRCIRLLRPEQDVFDPMPAQQPAGFPLCPLS